MEVNLGVKRLKIKFLCSSARHWSQLDLRIGKSLKLNKAQISLLRDGSAVMLHIRKVILEFLFKDYQSLFPEYICIE